VLQPTAFQQGLDGLWTPVAVTDGSGCEPSCNLCGNVCPTGAIRALRLDEKRAARMGLAVVDRQTCLPHAGKQECRFCAEQCTAAGYQAIEFERLHVEFDESGAPIEDSGFLAPVVRADRCVGCGLCQTRCFSINVREKGLLTRSAIEVVAGEGKEDRLVTGSYLAIREAERRKAEERLKKTQDQGGGAYLPDFIE
jgi:NAD-dependent dihydropyrimidine dehydrogenase PreA subunit